MEYCTPTIISWAQAFDIQYDVDYDPKRTSADELLQLVEEAIGSHSDAVVANLVKMSSDEYRELEGNLGERVRAIFDEIVLARYRLRGIVDGAIVEIRGHRFEILRLSARGNSSLRNCSTGKTRRAAPESMQRARALQPDPAG